ncbi:hypothetical protein [Flavobacterium sp. UBA6135]|uniref:hypothetical protein n=1 Tax=Flavobacterium sp. UBA6135 TaxID=1946553 RepID=UPI0025C01CB7|nr:hypothetical protein [Flavobacterium sp. UBA6135]
MSTVSITYNGNPGFEIADEFMQLLFHYIKEEVVKPQYNLTNKEDLISGLTFEINGYSSGNLSLRWSNMFTNSTEEQTMIQVLQNVIINLQNTGAFISVAEMQAIPTDNDDNFKLLFSRKPFPTAELIKIIDALIQMLQGTWTSTNYYMEINYKY